MEKLPVEIGLDILSRLSIASLNKVKCVCTSWRMLAHHPLLPSLQSSRMAQTCNSSLLLLSQNNLYSLQFSSSDNNNHIQTVLARIPLPMSINDPNHFSLAGSCNEFFFLLNQHDQPFICNVFNTDRIEIPKPDDQFHIHLHRVASGFGFHSLKKDYKVVRIAYYQTNHAEDANMRTPKPLPQGQIEVLTIGEGVLTWRNKGITSYQVLGRPSNVFVEDKLHWLTCKYRNNWNRKIISFDLGDEELREIPSPRAAGMFGRNCNHLVSLRGCLGGVVQGYNCLYIWVMKEYGVEDSWIKEYTISRLNPYADEAINSQCFPLNLSQVRVLCIAKTGEVLLQHRGRHIVAFDPNSGVCRELQIPGLPQDFNAVVVHTVS